MTRLFISSTFNRIELEILKLYRFYNSNSLNIDKDCLLRLIKNFELKLIEKYVQYYENNSLDINDKEND